MCVCVRGGGGGRRLSKLYGIPTLALIFHSGKNVKKIYLFGPFGGLLTHPLIITGKNRSQIKPIMEHNR